MLSDTLYYTTKTTQIQDSHFGSLSAKIIFHSSSAIRGDEGVCRHSGKGYGGRRILFRQRPVPFRHIFTLEWIGVVRCR